MADVICPGCNQRVAPARSIVRSDKSGKQYRLYRCPRERCGFYIDIEDFPPKYRQEDTDGGWNIRKD